MSDKIPTPDDAAAELAKMAEQINGEAPPLAEVPFSLTPTTAKPKTTQPELF
jgi:hypothetical protein